MTALPPRSDPLARLALVLVVLGGALLRLFAALRFAPHVDEGNSLLAAQMVAERGVPLLPSGVLYLHGATLSYLAAPISLLGLADGANLFGPRLLSVAAGTAAILLTVRLARLVGVPDWAVLLAVFLVAIDPMSVLWGGRFRMYALLQVVVLVVACYVVAAVSRPTAARSERGADRALVGVVVAFWLAVFTQLSSALLWPAMLLAAWAVGGWELFRERRALSAALVLCLLALPIFMLAGAAVGPGNTTARDPQGIGLPIGSFLGDDIVTFRRLLEPTLSGWTSLFRDGWFARLVPVALAILSGVVVGFGSRGGPGRDPDRRPSPPGLVALLALYWVPIVLFAFVSEESRYRYLLYVQPLGAVLAAAALALLLAPLGESDLGRRPARLGGTVALALATLLAANLVSGVFALDDSQEGDPNPVPALRYVAANRLPGETVVVSTPPEAYVVLGGREPTAVVGGALELETAEGEVDYWIGWPKLDLAQVCDLLRRSTGTWFVLEQEYLTAANRTAGLISGAADEVWRTGDGVVVLRSRPPSSWGPAASGECA